MTQIKIEWPRRANFQHDRIMSTFVVSGRVLGSLFLTLEAHLFPKFVDVPQFIPRPELTEVVMSGINSTQTNQ